MIAHTYSSATVLEMRVNGAPHNEAGLNAIRLGHHGVPVMLVAGDDALAGEVEALLPWAERVVVKRGLGTNRPTRCRRPRRRRRSARAWRRALARIGRDAPLPARVRHCAARSTSALPVMADYACVMPGVERIGPRTVAFGADDGDALYRTFLALTAARPPPGGLSDRRDRWTTPSGSASARSWATSRPA